MHAGRWCRPRLSIPWVGKPAVPRLPSASVKPAARAHGAKKLFTGNRHYHPPFAARALFRPCFWARLCGTAKTVSSPLRRVSHGKDRAGTLAGKAVSGTQMKWHAGGAPFHRCLDITLGGVDRRRAGGAQAGDGKGNARADNGQDQRIFSARQRPIRHAGTTSEKLRIGNPFVANRCCLAGPFEKAGGRPDVIRWKWCTRRCTHPYVS